MCGSATALQFSAKTNLGVGDGLADLGHEQVADSALELRANLLRLVADVELRDVGMLIVCLEQTSEPVDR